MTIIQHEWTGLDLGTGEYSSQVGPQSFLLSAPTIDTWTLLRVVFSPSLRAAVTAGTISPVDYWWVGSEVEMDVSFSFDGTVILPDINSRDPRIIWLGHLQPTVFAVPTSTANQWRQHITWQTEPTVVETKGERITPDGPTAAAAVCFNITTFDQHGVFTSAGSLGTKAFNVDMSASALWGLRR